MEIGNKIMELRKKNGLSQEELAEKVGVARQTISKWELGETSPDLKQSKELSNIFNVSLDELVSNDIHNILIEKTSNTEKLAGIILKLMKFFFIFIGIITVLYIIMFILRGVKSQKENDELLNTSIECKLHDKTYKYEFNYYAISGKIESAGGDGYIANITNIEKYDDVYQALDVIDAYVKNNGGTCIKSETKPYYEIEKEK